MDYTETVKGYLLNCKADGKSERTVESYGRALDYFGRFLYKGGVAEPTPSAVALFKCELAQRGDSTATIWAYMTALSLFFRWCVDMKYLTDNPCPTALVPKLKAERKPYEHLLTLEEFERVVNGQRPPRANKEQWARDKAILTVFLTSALRNTELCELTVGDCDFVNEKLTVMHGKGDKYRLAAFPPIAQTAVAVYLKSGYRPNGLPTAAPLFGIENNGQWHGFDRKTLSKLVERKIAGITGREGIRTHALRHACSSVMLEKSVPLDMIRDLLGHRSLETTQRYAERLNPETAVKTVNAIFEGVV